MVVLDDWESQDKVTSNPDWDGWTGDTGSLSVNTYGGFNGYAGRISGGNFGNFQADVSTTFSAGEVILESISFDAEWYFEGTNNTFSFNGWWFFDGAGAEIGRLVLADDTIHWSRESGGRVTTQMASGYAEQTVHSLEVQFDWATNQVTILVDGVDEGTIGMGTQKTFSGLGKVTWNVDSDFEELAEITTGDITYTVAPPNAPSNVDASYVADDQVDLSWSAPSSGGPVDSYDVQISRDGSAYSTPASGSGPSDTSNTSASYGPDSDAAYDTFVGIDSSFQFRVRAAGSGGNSGWTASDTVWTSPLPPENVNITRSGANSIQIHGTIASDRDGYLRVQYREDTGGGYGAWKWFDNEFPSMSKGSQFSLTNYQVGTGYQSGRVLKQDARYQWRIRHQDNTGSQSDRASPWIYCSTGNAGGIYFSDGFESGDLSAWTSSTLSDPDSGVTAGGDTSGDLGIGGAADGSNWLRLDAGDDVVANLGDLSSESNVAVKAKVAAGSMDSGGESVGIEWYDGTSWQQLRALSWEYNKTGWVQVTALVPDADLSTDNRLRLRGYGGGGDHAGFDSVEVADLLHEYTAPPAATSVNHTPGDRQIQADFNAPYSLPDTSTEFHWRIDGSSGFNQDFGPDNSSGAISYTWTGGADNTNGDPQSPRDGELYEARIRTVYIQDRDGSVSSYWTVDTPWQDAGPLDLPAPTGLSPTSTMSTSITVEWQDNHNYGDSKVQSRRTGEGDPWVTDATLSIGDQNHTIAGLLNGEQYDVRVLANTEHTQTEDA